MSYINNNCFGMNLRYNSSRDGVFDRYLYSSDQRTAGSVRPQDLYLHSQPEGRANQFEYKGCTLLDEAGREFVDSYALRGEYTCSGFVNGGSCDWLWSLEPILMTPLGVNVDGLYPHQESVNTPNTSKYLRYLRSKLNGSPISLGPHSSASQRSESYSPLSSSSHLPPTSSSPVENDGG
jgi:hypothetical protein